MGRQFVLNINLVAFPSLVTYICMMENTKIRVLSLDFARNDRKKIIKNE